MPSPGPPGGERVWRLMALPMLLALAVRVGLVWAGGPPETWEYDALARSVLGGQGYVYEHLGTPYRAYYSGLPYIFLTAAVYRLWPEDPRSMLCLQAAFAALTTGIVVWLTHRLAGTRAALLAGVLTALDPALLYYDVRKLHPLGLDTLLTTAVAASLLVARPLRLVRAGVAGLVLGLGLLQRGSLLPFAGVAVVWLLSRPGKRRRRALAVAAYTAAAAAVVAPWLVRNARIYGRPVLANTTGQHFFIGNVPPSQGSHLLPSGQPALAAFGPELRDRLDQLDEVGQDRLFWQRGWQFVRLRPSAFLHGIARKFLRFWTLAPQTGVRYPAAYKFVYLAFYACVLGGAAWGATRLWRGLPSQRQALLLVVGLFLSVSLVHALLFVEMRHRWALEPLMLMLAALGPAALWQREYPVPEKEIRP